MNYQLHISPKKMLSILMAFYTIEDRNMKKLFSIFTILAAIMLTSSCQKELPDAVKNIDVSQGEKTPSPTPTPASELKVSEPGQFGAKGGEQTMTVTATAAWTISKSAESDWLTIKPESGNAGTAQVTLTAAENTTTGSRTATLTVKSGELTKSINVSQSAANPVISLDTSSLEFASSSGSKSIKITSNTSWTVASDQAWCSVSPTSGSNDGSVTVKVEENTSTAERTATITVKSEAGDQTVKVTQSGVAATLTLDTSGLEFTSGSGSKMFRISSNTMWAISSDKNWCSVSPTSGSNDGSVTVSVEENTSTSERTATITVETSSITQTLSVTQNGATPVTPPASQDRTFTVGGVTFKMIYVEGGTFTMGATSEQGDDADSDEKPTHSVTLSSYSIGETEVTQALWQAVMGSNPSYFSGSNKPVEEVSWDDCQDFIRKLNALTGENFRLPTEAEWEYAARGGNKSRGYKYAGSNNIDNVAWYSDNSGSQTHNVATKSPNELGLYDMSGNVWEWCQDWDTSYSSGASTPDRVLRGGSWYLNALSCRVSNRSYDRPAYRGSGLGLRLAL
jgi:formylglycine-generating enzyme required for sulfatase activity